MSTLSLPLAVPGVDLPATLRGAAAQVEPRGPCTWNLRLPDEGAPVLVAHSEAGWLALTARLPSAVPFDPWGFLQRNAAMPSLTKFALDPGLGLLARVEVSLGDASQLAGRLAQATTQLVEMMTILPRAHADPANAGQGLASAALAPADITSIDVLQRVIEQAKWPVSRRASGRLFAHLDSPGAPGQALVEPAGAGARIAIELRARARLGAEGRVALGQFLLAASGVVPLARGFAVETPERIEVGAEVLFVTEPTAPEMDAALGALSVFCGHCAEEVRALEISTLAREYLGMRGQPR